MRSRLLVLAAAVLFSTGGAAIKATSLTAWQVASLRSGIAALAILAMLRGARRVPDRSTWLVGAVYAATMVLDTYADITRNHQWSDERTGALGQKVIVRRAPGRPAVRASATQAV